MTTLYAGAARMNMCLRAIVRLRHEISAALFAALAAFAAPFASARLPDRAELMRLRAGAAGIEVAGIVMVEIDERGRLRAVADGCAQFAADGRRGRGARGPGGLQRVASISKLFTAAAIVDLERRGALDLDRGIDAWLGAAWRHPAFAGQPLTVRQLLNHTASLIDSEQYWAAWPARIVADGATHRFDPEHPPGTYFRYSNFGYVLLGQVLESVTGQRFDRWMNIRWLQPAKIRGGFNWSAPRRVAPRQIVTLYRKQGSDGLWRPEGPWIPQIDAVAGGAPQPPDGLHDYRAGLNGSIFSPHGGLRISIPDLARWLHRLEPSLFEHMVRGAYRIAADGHNGDSEDGFYTDIGLGLHAYRLGAHGEVWGHFGDAYGLRAAVLRHPTSRRVWAYA
ncbi:MAG: beta-lactamase family protein, partial [Steroidobacteraceae bacterium]|nr:beta-lactamase family protein [Steroidobacteraceae bacterium]